MISPKPDPDFIWKSRSGRAYSYKKYPIGTNFRAVPGNYIFAKVVNGSWSPIYIGETGDLSDRFADHHQLLCIKSNGATHIFVHVSSTTRQLRIDEETDLRHSYTTPCNQQ